MKATTGPAARANGREKTCGKSDMGDALKWSQKGRVWVKHDDVFNSNMSRLQRKKEMMWRRVHSAAREKEGRVGWASGGKRKGRLLG